MLLGTPRLHTSAEPDRLLERGTIEVALPPGDAEAVAARLVDLLQPDE